MPTFPDLRPDRAAKADPTAVRYLQTALNSQGYHVTINGKYDAATQAAVLDFQGQHIDSKGRPLEVDAWVGVMTWWAIQNPSGTAQRNNIEADTAKGLSPLRRKILATAFKDHAAGTHEIPDGSNYGDGVTRYLVGVGPAFWCCFAVSTWFKDVTGEYPYGKHQGSVKSFWDRAKKDGRQILKGKTNTPVPGDAFVMLYRNSSGSLTGLGHIGLVAAASVADNVAFNTVEGNAGNRVKIGQRSVEQSTLVGYIDLFGDREDVRLKFKRGLLTQAEKTDSSLASTR